MHEKKEKQLKEQPQEMCVDDFDEAYMEEIEKQWMQMSRETAEKMARNFGAPDAKYND